MKPTARFKDYLNGGEVVVQLNPGQTLRHHRFTPTDEGYDRTIIQWEYDGHTVTRTHFNEGRDCDGYMSSEFVQFCSMSALRSETREVYTHTKWVTYTEDGETWTEPKSFYDTTEGWPNWTEDSHEYYDANAVAAGY